MKHVLFLNLRPIVAEGLAALMAAKNADYNVVLMSNKCPKYANSYIKSYIKIDNQDEEACITQAQIIAQQYDIKGVFSWNDTDIILAAKIAKKLHLNHVLPDVALLAKNKFMCREMLSKKAPHLVPKFAKISTSSCIDEVVKGFKYPLIVKPISASGSMGIFTVNNIIELQDALKQLEHKKNNEAKGVFDKFGDYYIVEEFLRGREISVEAFVSNTTYIAGITDKTTTNPWYIESRHIFPSNLPQYMQNKIINEVKFIVNELGINHSAIHVEMKIDEEECKIVEIATRTGGDLISSHLVPMALNIPWLEIIIKSTINGKIDDSFIHSKEQNVVGIQFHIAKQNGVFNGLSANIPNNEATELMEVGATVVLSPTSFNQCRVGYSLAKDNNYHAVEENLNQTINFTNIDIRAR